jgi:hypothetical protein
MSGFEVVPGSVRAYVLDDDGHVLDDDGFAAGAPRVRASDEVRREELGRERRRLLPIIEKGKAAERQLEAEAARQLREVRSEREFSAEADDPEASADDNQLYTAFADWKRGDPTWRRNRRFWARAAGRIWTTAAPRGVAQARISPS